MSKGNHHFIFQPGIWLGEGKVKLSISDEELRFFTRWNVKKEKKAVKIPGFQEIEIKGIPEKMCNYFSFYNFGDHDFKVKLENQNIGEVIGEGIIRKDTIAWEFRLNDIGFEGFEFYKLQEDGSYFMHAEYVTQDEYRTVIQGKIWKKSSS
ncbi:hypothetical protein COB11_06260 [Candidatus Aerophobetes bacterium]|uniref:Uncharacterized protein n=1 Tax=Aerophobetes bacterium TaxID=2030807 RepID=A0A2A4YE05_UNCAE|nr:MAG: hypothetical protein COB11_06260 [Candidatus Aerophobetes bacterium]